MDHGRQNGIRDKFKNMLFESSLKAYIGSSKQGCAVTEIHRL